MRRGRIFKRCTGCGKTMRDRRCAKCGGNRFSWSYCVDTHAPGEPRRQAIKGGFSTRAEAQAALTDVQHSVQHHNFIASDKLTVADYLRKDWLPAKASNLKPTTLRSYEIHVERHVASRRLGSVPLQQVTGAMLNALYSELLTKGRHDGEGGLSVSSVRRVHAMLSKAFADAVRWRKIIANPATAADPPKLTAAGASEMNYWNPEEARAFLACVEQDRLFSLWRVYLATGMRRGEALALRRRDLDLDDARVTVARSVVCVDYVPQISTPKNGKTRTIDLDAETVAVLRAHLRAQAEDRLALGLGKQSDDGLVFTTIEGEPVHPDSISNAFEGLVKRAGVRRIRLHDTRHTHVAIAIDQGADPKTIQTRLGHHSVAFTLDRYGHLFPARQREVADAIGRALSVVRNP